MIALLTRIPSYASTSPRIPARECAASGHTSSRDWESLGRRGSGDAAIDLRRIVPALFDNIHPRDRHRRNEQNMPPARAGTNSVSAAAGNQGEGIHGPDGVVIVIIGVLQAADRPGVRAAMPPDRSAHAWSPHDRDRSPDERAGTARQRMPAPARGRFVGRRGSASSAHPPTHRSTHPPTILHDGRRGPGGAGVGHGKSD